MLRQGFEPWSSARKAKMIGRTTPTERIQSYPGFVYKTVESGASVWSCHTPVWALGVTQTLEIPFALLVVDFLLFLVVGGVSDGPFDVDLVMLEDVPTQKQRVIHMRPIFQARGDGVSVPTDPHNDVDNWS